MIIDRIENIKAYAGLGEHFRTAAEWLAGQDIYSLAPGQIGIDGEKVFATLADNQLSRKEPAYEAHRLYADIQLVIDGKELFDLGTEGESADFTPGSDFCPCEVRAGLPFTLKENPTSGQLSPPGPSLLKTNVYVVARLHFMNPSHRPTPALTLPICSSEK